MHRAQHTRPACPRRQLTRALCNAAPPPGRRISGRASAQRLPAPHIFPKRPEALPCPFTTPFPLCPRSPAHRNARRPSPCAQTKVLGRRMGARGKEESPFSKGFPPSPASLLSLSYLSNNTSLTKPSPKARNMPRASAWRKGENMRLTPACRTNSQGLPSLAILFSRDQGALS